MQMISNARNHYKHPWTLITKTSITKNHTKQIDPVLFVVDDWKNRSTLCKFNQTNLLQETLEADSNQCIQFKKTKNPNRVMDCEVPETERSSAETNKSSQSLWNWDFCCSEEEVMLWTSVIYDFSPSTLVLGFSNLFVISILTKTKIF